MSKTTRVTTAIHDIKAYDGYDNCCYDYDDYDDDEDQSYCFVDLLFISVCGGACMLLI